MPFIIDTKSTITMTAMIRAKQLAQKDTQDRLVNLIANSSDIVETDLSGKSVAKKINNGLKNFYAQSLTIRETFLAQQESYKRDGKNFAEEVGYPILFSKTHLQLDMAKQWAISQDDDLISNILKGNFYHNLKNDISVNELPILASASHDSFWGNENSSVTSVLLASIASILHPETFLNLTGAATFYPFYNSTFTVEVDDSYPFIYTNGLMLFGDYQFGAHRYFSNSYPSIGQTLFAGEDCSSAVAKATNLTEPQVLSISTAAIKEAYSNPDNKFSYKAITQEVKAGDIYLSGHHTAIIAEVIGTEINTLGFNRDIEIAEGKQLGGGSYKYNLADATIEKPIFILRSCQEPLHESSSLASILDRIDTKYHDSFDAYSPYDMPGDCYDFFIN